jgi:hypothetical protein
MRWIAFGCTLALVACASPHRVELEAESLPVVAVETERNRAILPSGGSAPVLGKLVTHDEVLTIVATDRGPRFSVTTRDGRLVSRELTEGELAERHQDLAGVYRTGTASRAAPYLDATLDQRALETPQRP